MLSKLVLQNYKAYKQLELDLNFDVNIIVGNNESGKSTILEAINLVQTGQLNGKYIGNALTSYLFNNEIVSEYITGIRNDSRTSLPSVIIEAYFYDPDAKYSELKGSNNSLGENVPGLKLSIHFNPDFQTEYEAYIKDPDNVKTIPIEYYNVEWSAFSGNPITYRSVPFSSILIDTTNIKLPNGTDRYISKIMQDTLEPSERTELALNYRNLKESFASIPSISAINEKLNNKKGEITDKDLSISVDISNKSSWETILTSYLDDVPFEYVGKGEQSSIKMKLALETNADEIGIVLIEEPENHLSFTNMNKLVSSIKKRSDSKQLILTTHSSFILNKLDLSKMIMISEDQETSTFNDLSGETRNFFLTLPGYDTLRFVLSNKIILVEGPSDELIVQRAYKDIYGNLPIEDGIDVFCVDALSFKRFLDLAISLSKPVSVITDNDGDIEKNILKKYKDYIGNNLVNLCYAPEEDYRTLEPQILFANRDNMDNLKLAVGKTDFTDERFERYMTSKSNKTKCALKIFESEISINMPGYIIDAFK